MTELKKEDNILMKTALRYVSCGFAVFPLQKNGKIPIQYSNGVLDATDNTNQVSRWFGERYPGHNIGVKTTNEYFVVDIDGKNDGFASWRQLIGVFNNGEELETFTVSTGSGNGKHIYLKNTAGISIRNSASLIGAGIDVRGDGGYVVSAMSNGPKQPYEPSGELNNIAEAPKWLLDIIQTQTKKEVVELNTDDGLIPNGQRNESLTTLAGGMRRIGLNEQVIAAALLKVNPEIFQQPLPDNEVMNIAKSISRYEPDSDRIKKMTVEIPKLVDHLRPVENSYVNPFVQGSFLERWVSFSQTRNDSPPAYHEMSGLMTLASVTYGVNLFSNFFPDGLATNFYAVLVGDSGRARKSTVLSFAKEMINELNPAVLLPDHSSPEGFMQALARANAHASVRASDEFGDDLNELLHKRYMEGLKSLYKTLYASKQYTNERHSKLVSGSRIADEDKIVGAHLSILGAATETLFEVLTEKDASDGFLGRFLICFPSYYPEETPMVLGRAKDKPEWNQLYQYATNIRDWASIYSDRIEVEISDENNQKFFDFQKELQKKHVVVQRYFSIALKFAMLIELSAAVPSGNILKLSDHSCDIAIHIARRYMLDALFFVTQIGGRTEWEQRNERAIDRVSSLLQSNKKVARAEISRKLKIDSKALNSIKNTLLDRDLIEIIEVPTQGRSKEVWTWLG